MGEKLFFSKLFKLNHLSHSGSTLGVIRVSHASGYIINILYNFTDMLTVGPHES